MTRLPLLAPSMAGSCFISPISPWQVGHHVAIVLRRTTLPEKPPIVNCFPVFTLVSCTLNHAGHRGLSHGGDRVEVRGRGRGGAAVPGQHAAGENHGGGQHGAGNGEAGRPKAHDHVPFCVGRLPGIAVAVTRWAGASRLAEQILLDDEDRVRAYLGECHGRVAVGEGERQVRAVGGEVAAAGRSVGS